MREELGQAQARIETLLEMGDGDEGRSEEGSEEASMAFDKVSRPIGRHSFLPLGRQGTADWRTTSPKRGSGNGG